MIATPRAIGFTMLAGVLALSVSCSGRNSSDHDSDAAKSGTHGDSGAAPQAGVVTLTPEQRSAAGIVVGSVERRPLAPQLSTTGEVGYEEERLSHVSTPIPGRVVRVVARLGDKVEQGSPLAVLDSVELGQAKSAYVAARTREDLRRENFEREKRLYDQRISSEKEMLEAKAQHLESAAERQSAEETLRLYGVSEREFISLKPGDPSASHLAVRAPIAGDVVEKHVVVGELVTPERSLFTVADLRHVWIWIDVYERDLTNVHLRDDVEVVVDALPDRAFTGEVTYLAPNVEVATRTVRARIDVDNRDGLLRPGMFAKIRLTDPHGRSAANSLVVPESAVVSYEGKDVVFVALDIARFNARPVETGRREGGFFEILSGLEGPEQVVTTGTFFLKSELARAELGGGHAH